MLQFNRRTLLRGSLVGAGSAMLPRSGRAAVPEIERLETKVISWQPHLYKGWPTIARRGSGELLVVWSGGRETHVCPFGQVKMMRSYDDGQSWTWPNVILDGPIDDRDAGVLETVKQTLLVTSFSSLAYQGALERAEKIKPGAKDAWDGARLTRWQAAHRRVSPQQRQAALGVWMTRSTDGGLTWSPRYDCLVSSPHGPIQLRNGWLLYAGKQLWSKPARVGVCLSKDDGRSWQWLSEIPLRDGDSYTGYHELHAVDVGKGHIVLQIRNHNKRNVGETLQCESNNGGKSWSTPHAIGVWGLPSHLLRLGDGRLLMTFGHRRAPLGNQARISKDQGRTWSESIRISEDAVSGDLGYPSTVQLDDGTLLSVWYETMRGSPKAVLRQAHWKLA